jgi:OmpA-OmpF porin, OOP family
MSQLGSSQPDLMGMVKRQITPDVIRSVSSRLGEDSGRTESAIATSVPSVLTALSDVASTDTGAAHLKEMIDEKSRGAAGTRPDTTALLSPGTGWAADRSAGLIDGELGSRASTLSNAVADSSGIRRDSAHKLMGGVASVAVSALASSVGGMGSGGLQHLLQEQRGEWVKRLPGPVASLFNGHGGTVTTERRVYEERVTGPAIRRLERPTRGWLIPLILLGLAALLMIPLIRGIRRPSVAVRPQPEVTHTVPPPAAPPAQTAPAPAPATPPAAQAPAQTAPAMPPPAEAPAQTAPATPPPAEAPPAATAPATPGDTQDLAAFLNGAGVAPQTFAPRPLNFASGSAALTESSEGTLDDVATTLKDHPAAKIRLQSFTDNVGTPESNLQLSTARSESVKQGLVQRGVAAASIETAGLGQDNPIASNDTAEGRALNRRTEIVVTDK